MRDFLQNYWLPSSKIEKVMKVRKVFFRLKETIYKTPKGL
jgi:hypothetical protein